MGALPGTQHRGLASQHTQEQMLHFHSHSLKQPGRAEVKNLCTGIRAGGVATSPPSSHLGQGFTSLSPSLLNDMTGNHNGTKIMALWLSERTCANAQHRA